MSLKSHVILVFPLFYKWDPFSEAVIHIKKFIVYYQIKKKMIQKPLSLSAILLLSVFNIGCLNSSKPEKEEVKHDKQTYVLVHSAWLGAWQWENVTKELKANGHTVITPDLPGHGDDKTSPASITMENYVKTLTDILDKQNEPVILVGHSFNGITVSRVAELRPKKIKSLVYLTAFLLPNGGSFFGAVNGVEGSTAVDNFRLSEDKTYAFVKEDEVQNAFAHDITKKAFDAAKPYIVPEPAAPLMYELEITDQNFGNIPKYYIECTEDRAIPIEVQRAMYAGKVLKTYAISSSHTPFFSQPHKVASALLDVSNEQEKLNLIRTHFNDLKSIKFHRLFSNDNQIFAHFESEKGGETYAYMALLERNKNGKMLTAVQKVPENQVGENTMFNGVKLLTPSKTSANKLVVDTFINDVWIGGNVNAIQSFFKDGKIIQHNPSVENNVDGLLKFMQQIKAQGTKIKYQEILSTFASKDMVMTYSRGLLGGEDHFFADLFRLKNGKIIEHWDVIQKK